MNYKVLKVWIEKNGKAIKKLSSPTREFTSNKDGYFGIFFRNFEKDLEKWYMSDTIPCSCVDECDCFEKFKKETDQEKLITYALENYCNRHALHYDFVITALK